MPDLDFDIALPDDGEAESVLLDEVGDEYLEEDLDPVTLVIAMVVSVPTMMCGIVAGAMWMWTGAR